MIDNYFLRDGGLPDRGGGMETEWKIIRKRPYVERKDKEKGYQRRKERKDKEKGYQRPKVGRKGKIRRKDINDHR